MGGTRAHRDPLGGVPAKRARRLLAATVAACLVGAVAAAPAPAETIYAITEQSNLLRFESNSPGTIDASVPVTGLQGGESIFGIDFRPSSGQLYAVGSMGRIYTIDTTTGAATLVGQLSVALSGTEFGVDFNPVANTLRIVSNTEQNLRIVFGSSLVTNSDGVLVYAGGDPNFGQNPGVTAVAYSNNVSGAQSTTLYGIDSNLDDLIRVGGPDGNPSPNGGQLFTRDALGVDFSGSSGLDIGSGFGRAFAVNGQFAGGGQLYNVSLVTGQAVLLGDVDSGGNVRDLAIDPRGRVQLTSDTYSVAEDAGAVRVPITRSGSIAVPAAAVDYATADGSATAGVDYTAASGTASFESGETTAENVDIPIADDGAAQGNRSFTIALGNPSGGANLGSPATATVTIFDDDSPPGTPGTPSNEFEIGAVKGKRLTVTVAGAGLVEVTDAAARRTARAGGAGKPKLKPSSVTANGFGAVTVALKLTKAAKKKLRRKGRLKVDAAVTFTPTGGAPKTETKQLKLVSRR